MVFNYSKDNDYHTQINNRRLPLSTCNTTSMIMALKQAGVEASFPLKGVNTLLNKQVDRFSTGVSIEAIIAHLKKGGVVVLSGEFRLKNRYLHHIVSLAGFVIERQEDITHFIIDDLMGIFGLITRIKGGIILGLLRMSLW